MAQTLDLIRRTFGWTGAANASTSVQRDNGAATRTNLATVPNAATAGVSAGVYGWSSRWFGGSNNAGTNSIVSGAPDGPAVELKTYARKTWTALSGVAYDCAWSHTANGTNALPVTPGAPLSVSSYIRPSRSQSASTGGYNQNVLIVQWVDSSGATLSNANGPVAPVLTAGQWTRFTFSGTVPAGAAFAAIYTQVYLDTWQVGDTLDGTGLLIEAAPLGGYFDGNTAPVALVGGDVVPLTSTLSTLNGSSVPLMLIQFAGARTAQHVVHEILGRSDPDVTFMPTQTRAGTLTFLYESLDAVASARDLLALPGPVTLTQTDMPALSMTFVVTGDLEVAPDQQEPYLWTIAVPFREAVA